MITQVQSFPLKMQRIPPEFAFISDCTDAILKQTACSINLSCYFSRLPPSCWQKASPGTLTVPLEVTAAVCWGWLSAGAAALGGWTRGPEGSARRFSLTPELPAELWSAQTWCHEDFHSRGTGQWTFPRISYGNDFYSEEGSMAATKMKTDWM